jgi:hypothetical protein
MSTQPVLDPNDPRDDKATYAFHSAVYFRLPERDPPKGRKRPTINPDEDIAMLDDIEGKVVDESENPESGAPKSPQPGPSTGP